MVPTPRTKLSRPRQLLVAALLLVALGVGAWKGAEYAVAASHLSRARAALAADDPPAARRHLDRCLAAWPTSGEVHFLAAQAARRDGDAAAAARHFAEATRLNWAPDALALERALMTAQAGDAESVEPVLLYHLRNRHPESPQIFAALVPSYMAQFRWIEAGQMAKDWTELQPGSAKAWAYSGEILERLRRKQECVDALREAVRLNPADRRSRLRLAKMLLEVRAPADEADAHLRELDAPGPGEAAVRIQLALCREAQGRPDDAATILDRVIADHPPDAKAFHYRGRLEMNRGNDAAALPFLRRAADLDGSEVDILYSLSQCLRRAGTPAEATAAEERWKRADADLKRVAELSREISSNPRDPDLRREMGELFLGNGRHADGVRWLESALRENPDHAAAHAALAAHFEKTGRPDLAARHRK